MATLPTHLQFGQNHIPRLDAGEYVLNATQTLTLGANTATFSEELQFSIRGERFRIQPTQIHSLFPPANSLGEYSSVLPHLILNRTTLPWERHAKPYTDGESDAARKAKTASPWLALLVFQDGELSVMGPVQGPPTEQEKLESETGYSLTLDDLTSKFTTNKNFSAATAGAMTIELETGQRGEDRVTVIFAKKSTLQAATPGKRSILPSYEALHQLVHTRQGTDDQGDPMGDEMAVVISNRLPKAGATSIIHLVSLESRYTDSGFNFGNAGDDDPIPLISLKSWRFSSLSHKHSFRGLLLHLNQELVFRLPRPSTLDLNDNNRAKLLRDVAELFATAKKPIASKATIVDLADREVITRDYHFLIGEKGQVYNQAGDPILQLSSFSNDAAIISGINSSLPNTDSLPVGTPARPVDQPYLWLENTDGRYFLREENAYILVHKTALDHSPTLRLPEVGNATADKYLQQGYAPLPHHTRDGGKTISWFRGPLATSERTAGQPGQDLFQVRTADELVRYHRATGMFDVSYSAAWELGRLLALQSKTFSVGLYKWRRAHARAAADEEHRETHPHLPYSGAAVADKAVFPEVLHNWLERLWRLEGVPYNYLIPDDRMLPPESLRFFSLDRDWMASLVHGAFSIGRDAGTNHWQEDNDQHPVNQAAGKQKLISGFLLKSEVVSGWPGLIIDVFGNNGILNEVTLPVTRRQLAPNLLLCLFAGSPQRVDFHLKPETLHFGFHQDEDGGPYRKVPRGPGGQESSSVIELEDPSGTGSPVILEQPGSSDYNGVVDIIELFSALQTEWKKVGHAGEFGSGQFALAMIEGGERISYLRG